MTFGSVELWLTLLFVAVGIGFGWGRRRGRQDGFLEGVRFAPLELRRASLERACCIICGRGATEPTTQTESDEQTGSGERRPIEPGH